MSRLLLNEKPLMVMPKLAKKIGLNEAIIIQQIHYWNEINKETNNNFKDGHYWTFNSYKQWCEQFPFWGSRTIQRTISNLEKIKLVVTANYNKLKIDRTKWYRIDYKVLETLETSPFSQIDRTNMSEWLNHLDMMSSPLPETNSEINSRDYSFKKGDEYDSPLPISFEQFKNIKPLDDELVEVVEYYLYSYKLYRKTLHPRMKLDQWEVVEENMFSISDGNRTFTVDKTDLKDMIDKHFLTEYQVGCDYNILHFMNDGVRVNRMYEVAY